MTESSSTSETHPDTVDYLIVGVSPNSRGYVVIGSLTPDLVLPGYLQSLEQRIGYRDVHVVRRASVYERLTVDEAEDQRTAYPPQHRHMAKTTRSCQR